MSTRKKRENAIVSAALDQGGCVRRTRRGHLQVAGPKGLCVVAVTMGDWRDVRNAEKILLNEAGIRVDLRGL